MSTASPIEKPVRTRQATSAAIKMPMVETTAIRARAIRAELLKGIRSTGVGQADGELGDSLTQQCSQQTFVVGELAGAQAGDVTGPVRRAAGASVGERRFR